MRVICLINGILGWLSPNIDVTYPYNKCVFDKTHKYATYVSISILNINYEKH